MKKVILKNNKGFTMMETLIYIALFGIIMSGAVVGTYNLMEGGNRNIDSTKIEEEGTFINRKLGWALSKATDATVSGGGSTIKIFRNDGIDVTFSGDGEDITITRTVGGVSGVANPLNNDRFKVTDVHFDFTAGANGRPASISASFSVGQKTFTYKNYIRQ